MSKNDAYVADNIKTIKAQASPKTTVFADGSTFSYSEGYKSNGAPVRTRDSKPSPIVKTWKMPRPSATESVLILGVVAFIVLILGSLVIGILASMSEVANHKAVIEVVEEQGATVVGDKIVKGEALIRFGEDKVVPCDVDYRFDDDTPKGFVSCAQGADVLIVDVPFNPSNVFDFKNYLDEK